MFAKPPPTAVFGSFGLHLFPRWKPWSDLPFPTEQQICVRYCGINTTMWVHQAATALALTSASAGTVTRPDSRAATISNENGNLSPNAGGFQCAASTTPDLYFLGNGVCTDADFNTTWGYECNSQPCAPASDVNTCAMVCAADPVRGK